MRTKFIAGLVICVVFAVLLFVGVSFAGSLEPTAAPGPTMHTLEEIHKKLEAIYKKTGANFEVTGSNSITVLDNITGLVWWRFSESTGRTWADAGTLCSNISVDGFTWRLPTYSELLTLVDKSHSPTLPSGHPFRDVKSDGYWSSTAPGNTPWVVFFNDGSVGPNLDANLLFYVRCVR